MKLWLSLIGGLILTGCSSPDAQSGVTAEEAQELNEAAAMLDANATLPDTEAAE